MKKIILSLCILLASVAFAAETGVETPSAAHALTKGVKQVNVSEAKALIDAGAVILDARKPIDIARAKLKGAIRATYTDKGGKKNKIINWDTKKDKVFRDNLPSDKSATIVTYCNGPKCWKSYKLAVTLAGEGYSNVNWLRAGYPAWKEAGLPTE